MEGFYYTANNNTSGGKCGLARRGDGDNDAILMMRETEAYSSIPVSIGAPLVPHHSSIVAIKYGKMMTSRT